MADDSFQYIHWTKNKGPDFYSLYVYPSIKKFYPFFSHYDAQPDLWTVHSDRLYPLAVSLDLQRAIMETGIDAETTICHAYDNNSKLVEVVNRLVAKLPPDAAKGLMIGDRKPIVPQIIKPSINPNDAHVYPRNLKDVLRSNHWDDFVRYITDDVK
jgi:hypothetical protein